MRHQISDDVQDAGAWQLIEMNLTRRDFTGTNSSRKRLEAAILKAYLPACK